MRILFLNPQGNFDKHDSYWTEHPDFGGQLVYVKEIASELSKLGHKVDIVTRLIKDDNFPALQGQFDMYEGLDNLRIVRLPCGITNTYLNKEQLWPYLEEWVDNIIEFYENANNSIDFATGHYGDGGLACAMLKDKKNIPYSFTGHSLGAQKFDKLEGSLETYHLLDKKYNFTQRLLAERTAIRYSDVIFVSTNQEKTEQYTHPLYKEYSKNKSFKVVPPGANTEVFAPLNEHPVSQETKQKVETVIKRDIATNRKNLSMIISASRLDPKKNHVGLLKAYGMHKELQKKANILISLRGIENAFDTYSFASDDEKAILDELMTIITQYDLKGKVSFININSQILLADTYRYLTTKKGIFTLTALYEPFGLAPIEAMSTGLPVVVTKYGGPSNVLKENNEEFGVLVDVKDLNDIALGFIKLLNNYKFYQTQGRKRVMTTYTWQIAAKKYLEKIKTLSKKRETVHIPNYFYSRSEKDLDKELLRKEYLTE
ncbi:MAG: glycosyltransferase [Candidatus Izimaplasma sp.]|nr:glycosyltransferase [Candidatus Izimaplasma bacterium]